MKIKFISSPLFTLALFILSLGLLFINSLLQSWTTNLEALEYSLYSFVLTKHLPQLNIDFPFFPGGYTLAILWAANLLSLFFQRIPFKRVFLPLWVMHLSLLSLIAQLAFEQYYKEESHLQLSYGKPVNFSTSLHNFELVFVDPTHAEYDEVHTLDFEQFKKGHSYTLSKLKLKLELINTFKDVQIFFDKPKLGSSIEINSSGKQKLFLQERLSSSEKKNPALHFKLYSLNNDKFLGEYVLSPALPFVESVFSKNHPYLIQLQRKRHFFPYTFNLVNFKKELHPQTNIPKSFSSLIELYNENDQLERLSLIYMNQPLRIDDYSFYQASYSDDENTSILQVVSNPLQWGPYVSCIIMALALACHFFIFYYYLRRKRT
ncbi:MAG: hypothetical protein GWP59_04030 [Chlamydiales bacterium]|nr:cytochrome c biogenesis protein ResB [Chlamydiales bacterium]NCF70852.1 hypothetical protein [Chlamydiales bacterium]